MKAKDKKELRAKTIEELKKDLIEKKKDFFNAALDHSQNKLKNTRSLFLKRKYIAYLLTVLKEKEILNEKNA